MKKIRKMNLICALGLLIFLIDCQFMYSRAQTNFKDQNFMQIKQASSNNDASTTTARASNYQQMTSPRQNSPQSSSYQLLPQQNPSQQNSLLNPSSNSENRPFSNQDNYPNNYQTDSPFFPTSISNRPKRPTTLAPKECYRSLPEWKKDQYSRINSIMNYLQKRNGNTIILEYRFQKQIYNSFWTILPDGFQLYILRQKELAILNLVPEAVREPCCYSNVYYDCAYPPKNITKFSTN